MNNKKQTGYKAELRGSEHTVVEYEAPAYWASYLINGDDSGLSVEERTEVNEWIQANELPFPVDCRPAGIGQFDGMMCDLETYTFLT